MSNGKVVDSICNYTTKRIIIKKNSFRENVEFDEFRPCLLIRNGNVNKGNVSLFHSFMCIT